jgi:hypothetical protein
MATEEINRKRALPLAYRYESILKLFDNCIHVLQSNKASEESPSTPDKDANGLAHQLDGACYRFQLWAMDISVKTPSKRGSAIDVLGVIDDSRAPVTEEVYGHFEEMAESLSRPIALMWVLLSIFEYRTRVKC